MSMTLHYGDQAFVLAEQPGFEDEAERIERALEGENATRWTVVNTATGTVKLLVTPGIPIWFEPTKQVSSFERAREALRQQ